MLSQYEADNWKDGDLWEQFREDFAPFMEETFKACSMATKRKLRSFLRTRGVKVAKNDRNVTLAKCLTDVLLEEDQATWSIQEIQEGLQSGEEFISGRINYLLANLPHLLFNYNLLLVNLTLSP